MWRCKKCGGSIGAVVPRETLCRHLEFDIKKNKELGKFRDKIVDYLPDEILDIEYWCDYCYEHSKELEEIGEWK